ncbi:MAG TPA: hypothetical protein VF657_13360 [Actinoplanes sp.]
MTQPAAVETNGTVLVKFMPVVANPQAPTMAEINAAGALDLSCYLTGDGLNTDTSENNIEDARLCSKQTYESPGDFTRTLELTYVYNPESPSDDEARLELPRGTVGWIGIRWAVDSAQAEAAGDIWDLYPVKMGAQRKQTPGRNGVHRITQKPFVTGEMAEDVVAVA